jgi:hypothetical protein
MHTATSLNFQEEHPDKFLLIFLWRTESARQQIGRSHSPTALSLSRRMCSVGDSGYCYNTHGRMKPHFACVYYYIFQGLQLTAERGGTESSCSFQMACSKDETSKRPNCVACYTSGVQNVVRSPSTPYKFCQPNSTVAKSVEATLLIWTRSSAN